MRTMSSNVELLTKHPKDCKTDLQAKKGFIESQQLVWIIVCTVGFGMFWFILVGPEGYMT